MNLLDEVGRSRDIGATRDINAWETHLRIRPHDGRPAILA
jgi:hypothetical protein